MLFSRYGGPDLLNNEEKLYQDLLFTKHKGVNDIRVVEAFQNVPNNFNNIEHPVKPIQLSRRSSLRSFFPDFGIEQELLDSKTAAVLYSQYLDMCSK